MGLALTGYNEYYFGLPLNHYFIEPFDSRIPVLLNGQYKEEYIHSQLPNKLSAFVNATFLEDYRTNPGSNLTGYLKQNSVNDFVVKNHTVFIHGKDDQVVPFAIAEKTYRDLLALGTNPEVLTLKSFEGGHDSNEYLRLMLDFFLTIE